MQQTDSPALPASKIVTVDHGPLRFRLWIYPSLVALIYILWTGYMAISNSWHLFQGFWTVSVTMAFGSFIAGATPQGGATVAFPVFTKVLQFPSSDARTFGLIIQAIGMNMASVLIVSRRIRILPHIVGWTSLGGALGPCLASLPFRSRRLSPRSFLHSWLRRSVSPSPFRVGA